MICFYESCDIFDQLSRQKMLLIQSVSHFSLWFNSHDWAQQGCSVRVNNPKQGPYQPTHNSDRRQVCKPPAEFEPAIPKSERPQATPHTTRILGSVIWSVTHHHHHHISVMKLGHLLTRSGLTYPEVSSKVYHDSFCQLRSSQLLCHNNFHYLEFITGHTAQP